MNWFKKILFNLRIFFNYLIRGLHSADKLAFGTKEDVESGGQEINIQNKQDNVYNALLKGEMTKEVEMLRDSMYRIEKESYKYGYNGGLRGYKLTKSDIRDKSILKDESHTISVIQENIPILKNSEESISDFVNTDGKNLNCEYTFKFDRDFTPKYYIEKYITKAAIKILDNNEAEIDFYIPNVRDQFFKTHNMFLKCIKNIKEERTNDTYLFDVKSFHFISNLAYGADEYSEFRFNDMKYKAIIEYGMYYIIRYQAHVVENGVDLTRKYLTKEMDEKYGSKANKKNINFSDIYAYQKYKDISQEETEKIKKIKNDIKNLK